MSAVLRGLASDISNADLHIEIARGEFERVAALLSEHSDGGELQSVARTLRSAAETCVHLRRELRDADAALLAEDAK